LGNPSTTVHQFRKQPHKTTCKITMLCLEILLHIHHARNAGFAPITCFNIFTFGA
jgi:hypothetical protein